MSFRSLPLLLLLATTLAACDRGDEASDLPPDPGEPGRQTLNGIDSDTDGVRDDVQRYIALTYDDAPTRQALTQVSRSMLDGIRLADNEAASLDNLTAMTRGIECTFAVRAETAPDVLDGLRDAVVNTRERVEAYIALDARAGGGTFVAPDDLSTSCL